MPEPADLARIAFDSHDWEGALSALEAEGETALLGSDDLMLMADALYWTGQYEESLDAFEKAFSSFLAEGRSAEAGMVAGILAFFALRRQTFAVAGGWMARADELLQGQAEAKGHVWLTLLQMGKALFADGDVGAALELADRAYEISSKVGSVSGQSLALSFKAIGLIQSGDWKDGLNLIDESTAMAIAGEDLRMTSDVYCNTIASCRNLGDYKRAEEWTEEAQRWMRSNSVRGFTGACQVHRAELKRLHGSWLEAEDEARRACKELERFRLTDYLGGAHYEIGEVRRRMGDLEFAQAAFDRAYEQGHDAQPGLALLMLDRGEVDEALDSINKAMSKVPFDRDEPLVRGPSRARLLPAQIEIALEAGKREQASASISQLEEIATGYDSHVWKAAATSGLGALELQDGNYEQAIDSLGHGWRMWKDADLPYEMARTRRLLGEALRASGDEAGADREFKASMTSLEGLGATTEIARLRTLAGATELGGDVDSTHRVTRTFMFTDIVTSTDLIGLIGDSSWQDLLDWHNNMLLRAIEAVAGEVVRLTGDGFFASFADTRSGIDCAVDIQRRLASHRRESGFAPLVRIGLHRAEATRVGSDYSGGGIHLAARIGDFGDGEEIVVSSATLDDAGRIPYSVSASETVELKGISEPITLQRIGWRDD